MHVRGDDHAERQSIVEAVFQPRQQAQKLLSYWRTLSF